MSREAALAWEISRELWPDLHPGKLNSFYGNASERKRRILSILFLLGSVSGWAQVIRCFGRAVIVAFHVAQVRSDQIGIASRFIKYIPVDDHL